MRNGRMSFRVEPYINFMPGCWMFSWLDYESPAPYTVVGLYLEMTWFGINFGFVFPYKRRVKTWRVANWRGLHMYKPFMLDGIKHKWLWVWHNPFTKWI